MRDYLRPIILFGFQHLPRTEQWLFTAYGLGATYANYINIGSFPMKTYYFIYELWKIN